MATPKRKKPFTLRSIRPRLSEGDFDPVQNWIERNGVIPNGGVFIFDPDGNNVPLNKIRCKRTYFTMCRRFVAVPGCPALIKVFQLANDTRRRAMRAAERVKRMCELDPECNATISLQARAWGCLGGPFGPSQAHAGHCYRIVCK